MKKLSKILETYRKKNKDTYQSLAKKMHINKSNLYAYIKETRKPPYQTLEQIASYLKVDIAVLLDASSLTCHEYQFLKMLRTNPSAYATCIKKPDKALQKLLDKEKIATTKN